MKPQVAANELQHVSYVKLHFLPDATLENPQRYLKVSFHPLK